jgi:hypothetical protein
MFFNATRSKPSPPLVRPIEDQWDRESQRLWEKTANAVKERNHEAATDEKTKIEDRQREEAAQRAQSGNEWQPQLFRPIHSGADSAEDGEEDLEWIIDADVYVLPFIRHPMHNAGAEDSANKATEITPHPRRSRSSRSWPSTPSSTARRAHSRTRNSWTLPSRKPTTSQRLTRHQQILLKMT